MSSLEPIWRLLGVISARDDDDDPSSPSSDRDADASRAGNDDGDDVGTPDKDRPVRTRRRNEKQKKDTVKTGMLHLCPVVSCLH